MFRTKSFIVGHKLFFFLFIIWIVIGALLLFNFSDQTLFLAINGTSTNLFADYFFFIISGYGRGEFIALVLVGLLSFRFFRNKKYILAGCLFGIIVPLSTNLLKHLFHHPRPLVVLGEEQVYVPIMADLLYQFSFPSGHSIGAFALSTFLVYILPVKYKFLSPALLFIALLTAASRLYLGAHFFSDVYAGSIIGFSLGTIIYSFVYNLLYQTNEN